jgi:hypothetical protein
MLRVESRGDYVCYFIWTVKPAQLPHRHDFFPDSNIVYDIVYDVVYDISYDIVRDVTMVHI